MATTYVLGAVDTMMIAHQNGYPQAFCVRPGTSGAQITDITCTKLSQMAAVRDFDAPALVALAMGEVFPCS